VLGLRCLGCGGSIQLRTLSKTGLTPAVQDSVDQVIRHCVLLGDTLMALLAFPRALKDPCYLFEYSGHYLLTVTTLPAPFGQSDCSNRATRSLLDTYKRSQVARVPSKARNVLVCAFCDRRMAATMVSFPFRPSGRPQELLG
jgi:hypothetical protein